MEENNKIYITANELAEMLGVSVGHAYKLIRVRVYGSETATETMEDKILRLIQNEAANPCGSCGIMESPQMSRQSERSES